MTKLVFYYCWIKCQIFEAEMISFFALAVIYINLGCFSSESMNENWLQCELRIIVPEQSDDIRLAEALWDARPLFVDQYLVRNHLAAAEATQSFIASGSACLEERLFILPSVLSFYSNVYLKITTKLKKERCLTFGFK